MNKKIVLCGVGNMAEGILRGLLNNKTAVPEDVTVNELITSRCEYLYSTYGVTAVSDASDSIREANMVIIAVNPQHVPNVTRILRTLINDHTVVMSIAAGITIEALEDQLGGNKKIARVIPNTLIQSGNGYSGVCLNVHCDNEDKMFIDQILSSLGQIMYLEKNMFDLFQILSNVGPLWMYKMVEALTDAGVYIGFNRTDARNIAIKNMSGVAGVLDITGEHPVIKIDQMTSPGGVTIEALKVLQQEGFSTAIMNSVIAGVSKLKNE